MAKEKIGMAKERFILGLTEKAAIMAAEVVKTRKESGLSASKTGVVSEAIIAYYGNAGASFGGSKP